MGGTHLYRARAQDPEHPGRDEVVFDDARHVDARDVRDHGHQRDLGVLHEARAQLLDQAPRVLLGRAVHALRDDPVVLVGREHAPAAQGLAVVLLVPLLEVHARPTEEPEEPELGQAEDEVGRVQVEHAQVLVHPVRAARAWLGDLALLDQRGHRGQLQEDPAQLQVQGPRLSGLVLVGDAMVELVLRLARRLERQAQVQVVRHVGRVAVLLVLLGPERGHGRGLAEAPRAVRELERGPLVVDRELPYRPVPDGGPVRVARPGRAVAQDVPDVGQLRHEEVAAVAGRQRLREVLAGRAAVAPARGVDHEVQQRGEVQPLVLGRGRPDRRLRTQAGLGLGRVVAQERRVGRVGDDRVQGGHEPGPHIAVVLVAVAHVLERGRVVGLVEDVRLVLHGGEPALLVQRLDLRVVPELGVEEQDGHDARAVEELDPVHVGQERHPAREAQPALRVGHLYSVWGGPAL